MQSLEARAAEMRTARQSRPNGATPKGIAVVALYQLRRALIAADRR